MNDLLAEIMTISECRHIVECGTRIPDFSPDKITAPEMDWWNTSALPKLAAIYAKILQAIEARRPELVAEIDVYRRLVAASGTDGICWGVNADLFEAAKIVLDPR